MKWLDALSENTARSLARRTSRRSVLAGLGSFLLGAAAVPLLPVARGAVTAPAGDAPKADPGDPSSCDYWRHCAIDGFLCGCCGGSQSKCPPGTDMSPVTWIGTCHNPSDGKDYVISNRASPMITTGAPEMPRPIFPTIARRRASWVWPSRVRCGR
jgi:methylamine dehydrogenase light chain